MLARPGAKQSNGAREAVGAASERPDSGTSGSAVRVRFAPSPTGALHIGNVRSALFNYLFARHHGGTLVLRIDDTDRKRNQPRVVEAMYRDLHRLGLSWDEGPDVGGAFGPYVQSERQDLYAAYVERLLDEGLAYRCYCTEAELEARKAERLARGEPPRYDRRCLALSRHELRALAGTPSVVRLRLPDTVIHYHDLVYGAKSFDLRHAEDLILARSDGSTLYDLASTVDDHLMGITHILRGDTWLSTTPSHIALFQALGWEPPAFAHLPQIVGPDRKKLAKRHGARSLRVLLEEGYLPEAVQNALALLGWSPGGDREVLSPGELIERFGLDRVQRSPALFDTARLDWLNGVHLRQLNAQDVLARCLPYLRVAGLAAPSGLDAAGKAYLGRALALCQDRLHRLSEAPEQVAYFVRDPVVERELLLERGPEAEPAADLLEVAATALEATDFADQSLETALRALAAERQCPTGRLFWLARVAVTGCRAAPPLFAVLALLGRAAVGRRLRQAAARLRAADVRSTG